MSSSQLAKIIDVSIERAHEIAEQLQHKGLHDSGSTTVYSGNHSEYGAIHVVIPPLGDASLLPIVLRNFSL